MPRHPNSSLYSMELGTRRREGEKGYGWERIGHSQCGEKSSVSVSFPERKARGSEEGRTRRHLSWEQSSGLQR